MMRMTLLISILFYSKPSFSFSLRNHNHVIHQFGRSSISSTNPFWSALKPPQQPHSPPLHAQSNSNSNSNSLNPNQNIPLQNVDYTTDLTKTIGGYNRPIINWYPGHIAKAEHQLSETLKVVDIVLEVRDSRAIRSTAHPQVPEWAGGKPRIVICTKCDLIPKRNIRFWKRWMEDVSNDSSSSNSSGGGKELVAGGGVDLQVQNKAMQIYNERRKYSRPEDLEHLTSYASSNNNKKNSRKENIATQIEDILFIDAKRGQGIHSIHRAIYKAGQHVNERRAQRGLNERALRVGVIGYPNVGKVCTVAYVMLVGIYV